MGYISIQINKAKGSADTGASDPFAMRHDRSRRKPTNQIVKPEIEKQAWDI